MLDIKELADDFRASDKNVYRITVIKDGKQESVHLIEDNDCRNLYSVTKAYTMTAIGFLYDDGLLKPEDRICDIFKARMPDNADPKWYDVTVHDVLRHMTGVTEYFSDIDDEDITTYGDGGFLTRILSLPVKGTVGETYEYTDATYYMLSCIVTEKTGVSMYDWLRVKLFVPLRYKQVAWGTCRDGISIGGSCAYMSCEDMVKVGKLYLDGGVFEGKQIISREWVAKALAYGYAFTPLIPDREGYQKTGAHGQKLYFSKKDNMVVGVQSFDSSSGVGDVLVKHLKHLPNSESLPEEGI